jgi:hypothetical protein
MTDAREIINAACINVNQWRDQTYASAIITALHAAGFRILGPDEVDQVTLEKCAAEVKLLRQLLHSQTITLDVGREDMAYFLAEDAIRAIGRKA